jgi:hypothetical protein
MTKNLTLLAVFLVLSVVAEAKTVKLADYATPNDNIDDSTGFQRAIKVLEPEGGTLIVDGGTYILNQTVRFQQFGNYVSYKILGDKSSVLKMGGYPNNEGFVIGNVNQMEFRDLIFLGDAAVFYDTIYVIYSAYTNKLVVDGCQFFGLRASHSLIWVLNVDAEIKNTDFEGSGATNAVIYGAAAVMGLTVSNVQFRDYGSHRNGYYGKAGALYWIGVFSVDGRPKDYSSPYVNITRARFDEGAGVAIAVQNVSQVDINHCHFNLSGIDGSRGIDFDHVTNGVVTNSDFGYTTNRRPALKVKNGSIIDVSRLQLDRAVYFADIDSSSEVNVTSCEPCGNSRD